MKEFPQPYEKEALNEMYAKLNLPEEQLQLLFEYFDALNKFYNIISIKDAFDIISRQNKNTISKDVFIEFANIARHDYNHYYYILSPDELYDDAPAVDIWGMEIVHESLVEFDLNEYYYLKEAQSDIPLYIPAKNQLLEYKDDLYFPYTSQAKAICEFFCREMGMSEERAYDITGECSLLITISFSKVPVTSIFGDLNRMGVYFNDSQFISFHRLLCDLYLHTNMPRLRGFTPILFEKYTGITDEVFEELRRAPLENGIAAAAKAAKKVGRNDLCPCGSGKKYKKCCGRL